MLLYTHIGYPKPNTVTTVTINVTLSNTVTLRITLPKS